MALSASCSLAQPRPEEPAVIERFAPPSVADLKPLPAQAQATRQRQLRSDVEQVLGGGFVVRAQHGFVYAPDAVAGASVRNRFKSAVEADLGGVWLDAGLGVNERIATMVWRLSGESPRYLAYAWFTHSEPGESEAMVGVFELEKKTGAAEDKPHPKTGLWGGGAR
ncbi:MULTISPECIES: hypothetical protein [unclassified Lysobacter]|uniref:hypothetical protein n=1 Tax=unclassified Lysobacter TaxID=2635362 RepID=UPI001BED24E6|nr:MULTISPECIES: hypothetical protein [unclassified Lysobacter]MBT2745317.1 hypothetical protein [Lysobacter sp. ISL-42]MBT2751914.1 hypothetical protein [Lysobacter sp. ISL-50]MBT2777879.1 hypothetical protein [Lysobacter sp. ISL-54]MBT2783135.1 hypothetical protein [Lysobacter sp. ISL-52]